MAIAPASRTSHPPGLYVLFFTELWERYSFYSMMAILSLYMNESLHFDVAKVGSIYGSYNMVVAILMAAAIPLSLLVPQIKRTIQRAEHVEV